MPDQPKAAATADELNAALAVLKERGLLARTRRLKLGTLVLELEPDIASQLRGLVPERDTPQTVGGKLDGERLIGAPKDAPPEPEVPDYEYDHSE